MTTMNLLAPLGLLALLALPVIVILHMLRERRRRVVVPSLLLWQLLPQRKEAQQRRRLPWTLLLLLHLLAAALLAFALARPQLPLALFGSTENLAVIVDVSTSMAAPDGAGTRLDAAKERARALIGAVGARGSVTLIAAGPRPRLVDSGGSDSAARLLAALDALEAAGTGVDLPGALILAEAALQGRPSPRIAVLTDAAVPALAETGSAAVPVEFQRVGGPSTNRAVVAFAARPRSGSGPVQVYARVANYGDAPLRTVLRLFGDGQLLDTRPVTFGPQGELELTWAVPRGVALLRTELDGNDGLPADDSATISLDQTRPIRALLVSANPAALERALRAVPGLELNSVTPIAYAGSDADLTIFDGFLPPAWPAGGVLAVHPPPDSLLVQTSGAEREPVEPVLRLGPAASSLEGVSLGSVDFGRVRTLTPPEGFSTWLSRGEQPLILRGEIGQSAVQIWAFDLSQGNLTSRLAFPLLVARAVRDLTPPALPASALLGEQLELRPDPRADRLELGAPDGSAQVIRLEPGAPVALSLSQIGVYTLAERVGERTLFAGRLGVNAGAALESNLAPRSLPASQPAPVAALGADAGQRPLWPLLAALALLVMLGEWLYVHGRRRAPAEG
jgi:hypothetical protein